MRFKQMATATAIGLASGALAIGPAIAQQQSAQQHQQQSAQQQSAKQPSQEKIDIVSWAQRDLYEQGWTAEQLFDQTVYGQNGEEAGEVENLMIGPDGKLEALIVESGGFLDIADTHYRVPWDQVELSPDFEGIVVPVTAENIDEFSNFAEDEEDVPQRGFRATELINDYVSLADYPGYGMVEDLLFQNGELSAVIVYPDVGYGVGGPYAYPYYGYDYGFEPGADAYGLPYGRNEIAELGPFDYDQLQLGRPGTAMGMEQDEVVEDANQG